MVESLASALSSGSERKRGRLTLGSQVGLHTLAVGSSGIVNVLSSLVGSDEGDGLDARLVAEELNGGNGSMEDREDTLGETCGCS